MNELQQKHQLKTLIIGMEPTGHYWFNLANWLSDKGINVVMVNPATTKRNKENQDNVLPRVILRMHLSLQMLSAEAITMNTRARLLSFKGYVPL